MRPDLVERAAAGEEIIIAKAGRPMAELVQVSQAKRRRQPVFLPAGVAVETSGRSGKG
jgi:prevent-host-death family protein